MLWNGLRVLHSILQGTSTVCLAAWDMGEAWASFYPTNPFKFTLSSLAWLSYQVMCRT